MKTSSTLDKILQVISIVVSITAGLFILFNGWNISKSQAVVYGVLAILAAVVYAGSSKPSWAGVFGFIVLGAYAIARAAGVIEVQILRYALGFPLVAIGVWGMYSMSAKNKPTESSVKSPADSKEAE